MATSSGMIDTVASVVGNDLIDSASTRSYRLLQLRLDQKITVLPGQFAMIKPHGLYEPLLRRAMAYFRSAIINDTLNIQFVYQVLGRGTHALAKLRAGDEADFLGSLGNTFDIDSAHDREALLVAGGVGSAALFMLAEELLKMRIPTKLFIGGASEADLCGLRDFINLLSQDHVVCATVDGSYGHRGFVTAPLEKYLQARRPEPKIIYACGPDPMLHRVSQIADQFALPAQVSLESPMACGFGICVGCAVAIKADCPEGFVYQKVCIDGPVFWSHHLKFEIC